jgi:hypothetical protein
MARLGRDALGAPREVSEFIGWLCSENGYKRRGGGEEKEEEDDDDDDKLVFS